MRPKIKYKPFRRDYSKADWASQQNDDPRRDTKPRKKRLYRTYGRAGMSMDQISALWRAQHGKCANPGCGVKIPAFGRGRAVHHDPLTGQAKGMLCKPCNLGLGMFASDPRRMIGALVFIGYIEARLLPK